MLSKERHQTATGPVELYLAGLAKPSGKAPARSVYIIERRLSGISWNYAQRGFTLARKSRHIATVPTGIKHKYARPPMQKEAILHDDMLAIVATMPFNLRRLRDRAILILGYASGLRRSEIVSLDVHNEDTPYSAGSINILQ